ncbi:major facilitator superfamily domain-containing protein [Mycena floridula]|nr:major facilitator superfamily domain-containing protein [Mycena floridula]
MDHPAAVASNPMSDSATIASPSVSSNEKIPSAKTSIAGKEKASEVATDLDEFPDGGLRAWLIVFGTACGTFSTFGYVNAWGIFQSYYEETLLKDHSPSTIAWIGSIQYSLVFMPALVTGRLFDLGYFRLPLLCASIVMVIAAFLVAECTQYWHFILCQGIAVGLASGIVFGPLVGVIGHWFRRKRGLALACNAMGSSIGGTIFPIAARKLIPLVGFPWTMRILGFILVVSLAITNLTLRRRLPPKNVAGGLFNLKAFKSAPFSFYAAASFTAFLGLYTVLTYIDIAAVSVGVSGNFSFYLVSIANASSTFGRLMTGIAVDRFGAINFIAPMTIVAAVLTYAWPFAKSEASFIVIAILYGFSSGAFVATCMAPLYDLGEMSDIGRRTGMVMSIIALGALAGPPISGAINNATGGYEAVGYYAGSTVILSVALMLVTRHLVLRKLWGKF